MPGVPGISERFPIPREGTSMTDRELVELAAKAAGYGRLKYFDDVPYVSHGLNGEDFFAWNPLVDDGDALRLAVKLNLWEAVRDGYQHLDSYDGNDPYAATRRAIVRAAAQLAKP